jgi:hypothetical protein
MPRMALMISLFWGAGWMGCANDQGQEHLRLGEVISQCVVSPPAGIAELTAPISLEYPSGSLWIWGELGRREGES